MHRTKVKAIIDRLEKKEINSEQASDQIMAHIKEEAPLPYPAAKIISFMQWMFRKVDKGDEPVESMRMINLHREEIESIQIPDYEN